MLRLQENERVGIPTKHGLYNDKGVARNKGAVIPLKIIKLDYKEQVFTQI